MPQFHKNPAAYHSSHEPRACSTPTRGCLHALLASTGVSPETASIALPPGTASSAIPLQQAHWPAGSAQNHARVSLCVCLWVWSFWRRWKWGRPAIERFLFSFLLMNLCQATPRSSRQEVLFPVPMIECSAEQGCVWTDGSTNDGVKRWKDKWPLIRKVFK